MAITAPYNFVPLSKKVFFPDWADQVSHDVPFEDGISGEIVCQLTTQSPVYVRNGGNWNHQNILQNRDAQSFFNINGQVIIPGTSLKGMLRNVIEIATFSKMCRVDNHRYSVRDLNNKKLYQERFTSPGASWKSKSKAAWLEKVPGTNDWQLIPCSYARVEQDDLKRFHSGNPNFRGPSAVEKYTTWEPQPLEVNFTSTGLGDQSPHHRGKPLFYDRVTSLSVGNRGTIVFTGQAGIKHMEFIFFNPSGASGGIGVTSELKKNFQFVHSIDGDMGKPNKEWKYWKDILARGGKVPVFYLEEKGALHSFGLAQMYKLPYAHTIHDVVKNTSPDHFYDGKPDFAETLFGYVGETKNSGQLKGRVSVSHAVGDSDQHFENEQRVITVLGAPKPTYYPSYLEQPQPTVRYRTYMDPNPNLPERQRDIPYVRGWKRYPTREKEAVITPPVPPPTVNDDVKTAFTPLQPNAKFTFSIKVHNLKPAELGALIWALEWGGEKDLCHSLGMGKAFGYGLVQIAINYKQSSLRQVNVEKDSTNGIMQVYDTHNALPDFLNCMKTEVSFDWAETPQVFQLLAMANPKALTVNEQQRKLRQMNMMGNNEFVAGKGNRRNGIPPQALGPHMPFVGDSDEVRFRTHTSQYCGLTTQTTTSDGNNLLPPAITTTEEIWTEATLVWTSGNQELTISKGDKRAIVKLDTDEKKEKFIPTGLRDRMFLKKKKKKPIKATVTVVCEGNLINIVEIETPQT